MNSFDWHFTFLKQIKLSFSLLFPFFHFLSVSNMVSWATNSVKAPGNRAPATFAQVLVVEAKEKLAAFRS